MVVVNFVNRFFHFFGRYVGQKTETSGVDAQDGNVLFAHAAGSFQECAVASDADDHICAEIVAVEQIGGGNVEVQVGGQEIVELATDTKLCFASGKQAEKIFGMR